jgi:hypothetical protein
MRTGIVFALLLLASITSVKPADACSPPPCWMGSFVPFEGATIPANAPALYWRPSSGSTPATMTLTVAGTGAAVPFTEVVDGQSRVLTLTQSLVPGTQYVLEETNDCQYQQPVRSTFTAGPTAALPTTLGTTAREGAYQHGDITIATAGGSCSIEVDAAHATIALAHSADATPWKDLLLYETYVDGQRWAPSTAINVTTSAGASWRGRGRDQLYRVCEDNQGEGMGLAEGTRQAAFRARLPGSTTDLVASEVTVEIACADSPDGSGSGSGSGSNDPNTPSDPGGCCSTSTTSTSNVAWIVIAMLLRRRTRGQ